MRALPSPRKFSESIESSPNSEKYIEFNVEEDELKEKKDIIMKREARGKVIS
jgi:hypothetical protein